MKQIEAAVHMPVVLRAGIRSHFAVALADAKGHTRARPVATTQAGRSSATANRGCANGCSITISVANMDYAIVGYTTGVARWWQP